MPDLLPSLMHYLDSQSQGDTTAALEIRTLADPKCGSVEGKVIEEMSPYLYFFTHKFYKDGATCPPPRTR